MKCLSRALLISEHHGLHKQESNVRVHRAMYYQKLCEESLALEEIKLAIQLDPTNDVVSYFIANSLILLFSCCKFISRHISSRVMFTKV